MAITSGLCDSYIKEIIDGGTHLSTDTYCLALYDSSAVIGPTSTEYILSGEAFGTGYTAGGQVLTGFISSIVDGVVILDFNDATWLAVSVTTRGAMIYNASKGNKAVAVLDFGSDVTSTATDLVVQFPVPTATTGLIRIS